MCQQGQSAGWEDLPKHDSMSASCPANTFLVRAHDTGALRLQIKLGPPLFVPNGQIGSFGAISQIKSLVRNRTDLFDLAFSGPAAAGIVSLILFGVGLGLSTGGLPKVWPPPSCSALFPQAFAPLVRGPAVAHMKFLHAYVKV
jgi:hypothetical protein